MIVIWGVHVNQSHNQFMICSCIVSLDSQFFTNDKVSPRLFCTKSDSGQWSYATIATEHQLEAYSSMLEKRNLCSKVFWVFNVKYLPSLDCWAYVQVLVLFRIFFWIGIGFVNAKLKNVRVFCVHGWWVANFDRVDLFVDFSVQNRIFYSFSTFHLYSILCCIS